MKTFVLAFAVELALVSIGEAWSQQYPTKPIRVIVPFTAGSQADLFARMIAPKMSEN